MPLWKIYLIKLILCLLSGNHISTMRRKHLEFYLRFILSKTLTSNGDKFDWETMNTQTIKVIFNAEADHRIWTPNDYGTRIQIKCHQKIDRISQTLDAEECMNWELMDSFGVRTTRIAINYTSEDVDSLPPMIDASKIDTFYVELVDKFYSEVHWRFIGPRLTMAHRWPIDVRHE